MTERIPSAIERNIPNFEVVDIPELKLKIDGNTSLNYKRGTSVVTFVFVDATGKHAPVTFNLDDYNYSLDELIKKFN